MRHTLAGLATAIALAVSPLAAFADDTAAPQSSWPSAGGDARNSCYTTSSIGDAFGIAWRARVGCASAGEGGILVVDGLVVGVSP